MTPERWHQIRDLVESALDFSDQERPGYLDLECRDDPSLRLEVESLLQAHDAAGGFLDPSGAAVLADDAAKFLAGLELAPGELLGHYRLLRELGRGGMGTVYLAERSEVGEPPVAIKVAQRGLSAQAHRRLRNEYRILAQLNHPYIAKVLEAGVLDDGRPFFVMDYVEGAPIDRYCEDRNLTVVDRMELFLKICQAVAAAHERGVIHRDIKPSNIQVRAGGEPSLLDFGIAKIMDPEDQAFTVDVTRTGERFLTPQYASPEQIRGERITPGTDVYALGVLLYQLLTEELPYKPENYTIRGMERAFETQSPRLPSTVVAAPFWLPREALDGVVLAAIQLEPAIRYSSVAALAGDVERCLVGRPPRWVPSARRGTPRWILAACLFLLLFLGVLGSTFLWHQRPGADFSLEQHDRIVVGEFRNETGDPSLDDAIAMAFHLGFEQSSYFAVYSYQHVQAVLLQMKRDPSSVADRLLGSLICQHEGSKALVLGSLGVVDETYVLEVEVIDPRTARAILVRSARIPDQRSLISGLQEVVSEVRLELGEPRSEVEGTPALENITTRNLTALRSYSLAMNRFYEEQYEESARFLERAISMEPDFAIAHARLAVAYVRTSKESAAEHFSRALELQDRLTDYEKYQVRGWWATREESEEKMVEAWMEVSRRFPYDASGYFHLGLTNMILLHDYERSAFYFDTAADLSWSLAKQETVLHYLACALVTVGDQIRFDETLRRFSTSSQSIRFLLSRIYQTILLQDYEIARNLLSEARLSADFSTSRPWNFEVLWHVDQGMFHEARVVVSELQTGASQNDAAITYVILRSFEQEDFDGRGEVAKVLEELPKERMVYGTNFLRIPNLALVGKTWARQGSWRQARDIAEFIKPYVEERGLSNWRSYLYMLEGEIFLAQGFHSRALDCFEQALVISEDFQIRDSLAEASERNGDMAAAMAHSRWLITHRGRAMMDGLQLAHQVRNMIDWNMAWLRLARLYEQLGQTEEAIAHYQDFVGRWRVGNKPWVWRDARAQLERLIEARASVTER